MTVSEDVTGDRPAFDAHTASDASNSAPARHLDTPETKAVAVPNSQGKEDNTDHRQMPKA